MARLAPVLTSTFPVTLALSSWQDAPSGTTTLPLIAPVNDPVQDVSAPAAGSPAAMIPKASTGIANWFMGLPRVVSVRHPVRGARMCETIGDGSIKIRYAPLGPRCGPQALST